MKTSVETVGSVSNDAWLGRALMGAALACLIATGGLLWWHQGAAVFDEMILSALAWCF